VIGTPIDLSRVVAIAKPHTRVHYELEEIGEPNLTGVLASFVEAKVPDRGPRIASPGQ
jgi:predicted GTPase